jgi:hypothetical protein
VHINRQQAPRHFVASMQRSGRLAAAQAWSPVSGRPAKSSFKPSARLSGILFCLKSARKPVSYVLLCAAAG